MSDGGKGDKQIAAAVSDQTVTLNWSNIFGKSKLQQRLEAEQLAKDLELMEAIEQGFAKMADPIAISEMPELQAVVKQGLDDGSLVPS